MNARLFRNPMAIGIFLLALVVILANTFAIVPETKQAVILRFQKPISLINQYQPREQFGRTGAGIIAKIPFLDRMVWIDKRVLDIELDNQPVLSTDQLRLEVDAFARFRVVNPLQAVISTGSTANTDTLVEIRGKTMSPEIRTFSSSEYSEACSGEWPKPLITRQPLPPISTRSPSCRRV